MGISMISNLCIDRTTDVLWRVSIPNGDKHDFKRNGMRLKIWITKVSIPNGDKHDFKPTSSGFRCASQSVSIPNGDKHDFKRTANDPDRPTVAVSIPNGDKHDFKLPDRAVDTPRRREFQSPMGISMISNGAEGDQCLPSVSFNPQWG